MTSRRPLRWAAAAAAVVALAAGCARVDSFSFPTPPSTPATAAPTTVPALTNDAMRPVAGAAHPAGIAVGPGAASLSGTVVGPSGPVGGADVHVERVVGDAVAAADTSSAADGTWSMPGILGGRYRVRAWRAPDLDLTTPQIFFLADAGSRTVALQLEQYGFGAVATAVAPDPPVVGQPASLAVQINAQAVDANGFVRPRPVSGATAELANGPGWSVTSANPTVVSAGGRATWQLQCLAAGAQPLDIVVNGTDTYALSPSPCVAPPPVTTTTIPSATSPSTATTPSTSVTPGTTTTSSVP